MNWLPVTGHGRDFTVRKIKELVTMEKIYNYCQNRKVSKRSAGCEKEIKKESRFHVLDHQLSTNTDYSLKFQW